VGTGIGHYIPLVCYLACWVMAIRALAGKPLPTLYFTILLLPYRTMRDHFLDYPLGGNALTILVAAIIIGGLLKGKKLPKSSLFLIWAVFGIYLYFSMWFGVILGNAPPPLWLNDINFITWKDYMLIPLVFVAASLVIEDRKSVRTVILVAAFSLLAIDRSSLLSSLSRSWGTFDENKRDGGPLGFAGANGLAAFLAQFCMFFWGFMQFVQTKKYKILGYLLVATTAFATMYTFSRASYIAIIVGALILGILKDRKLLPIIAIFLVTWQAVVPKAVSERVNMTHNANGKLEASADERIRLWEAAKASFLSDPIAGVGYATYQMNAHTDNLRDTHNWYVKVLVETGLVGMIIALALIQQMLALSYRLFKNAHDPLYRGLGLGLFLATTSTVILNFFGDRWTYLEISGLLWVLLAAGVHAERLDQTSTVSEESPAEQPVNVNPYLITR